LTIISAESKYQPLLPISHQEKDFLTFMSDFLNFADTGIKCLVSEREPLRMEKFLEDVAPEVREEVENTINSLQSGELVVWMLGYMPIGVLRDEDGELWTLKLKAQHITSSGETRNFTLNNESEGTQRLIHLIPTLYRIKNNPTVAIIDEIDCRLHSKLTRHFIEMGIGSGSLPENQLIFTTHDTNLLDSSLLRRDEIYFVRKRNNKTEIERLSEYKVRADLNYEKAYEQGRVGGGGPRLRYELYELMEENGETEKNEEILTHAST
jgi:hypothetical protein